jgi:hypothetical protein
MEKGTSLLDQTREFSHRQQQIAIERSHGPFHARVDITEANRRPDVWTLLDVRVRGLETRAGGWTT